MHESRRSRCRFITRRSDRRRTASTRRSSPRARASSGPALEEPKDLGALLEKGIEFLAREVDASLREPTPAFVVHKFPDVQAPPTVALQDPHDQAASWRRAKRLELLDDDELRSRPAAGRPIRGGHQNRLVRRKNAAARPAIGQVRTVRMAEGTFAGRKKYDGLRSGR